MKFKALFFQKRERLYLRLLASLMICAAGALLVATPLLYFNMERILLNQVYSDDMQNLGIIRRAVSVSAETALKLAYQIYQDLNISKLRFYETPDIYDLRNAFTQLSNYRMSASFIEAIYVYNCKNGTIYIDSDVYNHNQRETVQNVREFDDQDVVGFIRNYRRYRPYIPIPRRVVFHNPKQTVVNYYSFFLYDIFSEGELTSAVIVNISDDWIYRIMEEHEGTGSGVTFIINSRGALVSKLRGHWMLADLSGEKYIHTILHRGDTDGYFVTVVDGVRSLVTYTQPDPYGWRYIRVTPLQSIIGRIRQARWQTVLLSLAILAGGLLAAYLLSRRLYTPFEQISRDLEDATQKNAAVVKEKYLRAMMVGRRVWDKKSPTSTGEMKKWDLPENTPCCVILQKIDHYQNFLQKYGFKSRSYFQDVLRELAAAVFRQEFRAEAVDMDDDTLAVIVFPHKDAGELSVPVILRQGEQAQSLIRKQLDLSVTLAVSPVGDSLEELPSLYNQAAAAALRRMFDGHGSVIVAGTDEGRPVPDYLYPNHQEKLLVDAFMAGDMEMVKTKFREIVSAAADHSFDGFNLALSHLILTINDTWNAIGNHHDWNNPPAVMPVARLFGEMETVSEIHGYFGNQFDGIARIMEKQKQGKHEHLVDQIHALVDQEFMNPDLSVELLADRLHLTSSYLCRIYKQLTRGTILDTITKARMDKAKELLARTRLPVAEIARRVGMINSTYFYKAFKKSSGMTPNDFRRARLREEDIGDSGTADNILS